MKLNLMLALALCFSVACSKKDSSSSSTPAKQKQTLDGTQTQPAVEVVTSNSREHSMSILREKNASFGAMLAASANYFKALPLMNLPTVSSAERKDDLRPGESREKIYLDSVIEFNRYIEDIAKRTRIKQMSPMKEGRAEERAFYAIATTMDVTVAPGQVSFYELIRNALIHEANNEPLEEHEALLMAEPTKTIVINLIKARVDMSATMAIRSLTSDKNVSLLQRGGKLLFELTFGLFGTIDLPETFYTSSETTKDQVIHHLDEAQIAKNFLREFHVQKDLEKRVRSALMKIELKQPKLPDAESDEEYMAQQEQLKKLEARKGEIREKIDNLLQ